MLFLRKHDGLMNFDQQRILFVDIDMERGAFRRRWLLDIKFYYTLIYSAYACIGKLFEWNVEWQNEFQMSNFITTAGAWIMIIVLIHKKGRIKGRKNTFLRNVRPSKIHWIIWQIYIYWFEATNRRHAKSIQKYAWVMVSHSKKRPHLSSSIQAISAAIKMFSPSFELTYAQLNNMEMLYLS